LIDLVFTDMRRDGHGITTHIFSIEQWLMQRVKIHERHAQLLGRAWINVARHTEIHQQQRIT